MINGMIIKGIGGFYYIKTDDTIYECKARGKFRKDKITPLVGDKVMISIDSTHGTGVIEEVLPRDIELIRPPVANVNQAIIVFAANKPEPNLSLLDRFLVTVEKEGLPIIICINKKDIDSQNHVNFIKSIYTKAGYDMMSTSTKTGEGIDLLKIKLEKKITVFAGPSGVGKSSLLNAIQANLALKTGEISHKNNRGKHTTRHVELMELEFSGWVVDTPGFSSLEIDKMDEEDLQYCFKEFVPLLGGCKFQGCIHLSEPDCAIKNGIIDGTIHQTRYESYVQLMDEIHKNRRY